MSRTVHRSGRNSKTKANRKSRKGSNKIRPAVSTRLSKSKEQDRKHGPSVSDPKTKGSVRGKLQKVSAHLAKRVQRTEQDQIVPDSVWQGPYVDGVTNSLLSKFLVCRERFRLKAILGLREEFDEFPLALEYGNIWHEAEEAYASNRGGHTQAVKAYQNKLLSEFPEFEKDILRAVNLVLFQFPEYVKRWQGDTLEKKRKPILAEIPFRVPYTLPSGRKIFLRGKWDGVNQHTKTTGLVQENKSKGSIDEELITKTLFHNLQTMIYQIAVREASKGGVLKYLGRDGDEEIPLPKGLKFKGTVYNVVRRPLSDRHAPRKKKKEREIDWLKRERKRIAENHDYFFYRWQVMISDSDIVKFKREVLDPILEQLCDWWEWIAVDPLNPWRKGNRVHFKFPWGIFNSLTFGWKGDYFNLLTGGSEMSSYTIVDDLFPEL